MLDSGSGEQEAASSIVHAEDEYLPMPHRLTSRRDMGRVAIALACLTRALTSGAQQPTVRPAGDSATRAPSTWTAAEDHRQMMEQLGIKALRPGPSGNEQDPNHANYDEAKANPFASLPDVLTLRSGRKVTTRQLWAKRRAEIVEDFEREVYGRVPRNVPMVTWRLVATDTGTIGARRVI